MQENLNKTRVYENSPTTKTLTILPEVAETAVGMQILVFENKPYTYLEVAEAVANAVWNYLDSNSFTEENIKHLNKWLETGHRKIVRRVSKESQWVKVLNSNIEGLETLTEGGLRVYVTAPHLVTDVEKAISRTQVSGFKPVAEETFVRPINTGSTINIFLNESLEMSIGKAAAAAGHIAQKAYYQLSESEKKSFLTKKSKFSISLNKTIATQSLSEIRKFYPLSVVDSGYTEVKSGSVTAVGRY